MTSAARDCSWLFWSLPDGTAWTADHCDLVTAACEFGSEGEWILGDASGGVYTSRGAQASPQLLLRHEASVLSLCGLTDGGLAAGLQSGHVAVHRVIAGTLSATSLMYGLPGEQVPLVLAALPGGGVAGGGTGGSVVRITSEGHAALTGHTSRIRGMRLLRDGLLATASRDTTIRLWAGPRCAHVLRGHTAEVCAIVEMAEVLASASADTTVRLWRGATCVRVLRGHRSPVTSLALLRTGVLASGERDGGVRLWV